jgi:hypothetical protein
MTSTTTTVGSPSTPAEPSATVVKKESVRHMRADDYDESLAASIKELDTRIRRKRNLCEKHIDQLHEMETERGRLLSLQAAVQGGAQVIVEPAPSPSVTAVAPPAPVSEPAATEEDEDHVVPGMRTPPETEAPRHKQSWDDKVRSFLRTHVPTLHFD